jgi:hypothetical protein
LEHIVATVGTIAVVETHCCNSGKRDHCLNTLQRWHCWLRKMNLGHVITAMNLDSIVAFVII